MPLPPQARLSPGLLGTSLLSLDAVHERWRAFAAERRLRAPGCALHFGSTDLVACYDTIDQREALAAVNAALRSRGEGPSRL